MNTNHGWHSSHESYSFTATVAFFSLLQLAAVIALLKLL
jgi:hypothetical protein